MLMYRRKTQAKVLITYLTISPTELFESGKFLKSNCAHRCMELFGITSAVVFLKTPCISSQLAKRIQNKLVFGITDFHDLSDRKDSIGIS